MAESSTTQDIFAAKGLANYLFLPEEISNFERGYLRVINRVAFVFFCLHPPILMAVAYLAGTGVTSALWMSLVALAGPALALGRFDNPRHISLVHGVTAMVMGGLLVHFGQGPVQIEMHFYFFVLLALLAVTANPMVVVAAAVTAAVHHALLYFLLPSSIFNYDAQIWVVGIHALFVVLESIAAVFVARTFFDNVVGLEKIVAARTRALDARNEDMRLLLDSVDQGFLTLNPSQVISAERSTIVERWFSDVRPGETWTSYLGRVDPEAAEWFRIGWDSILEGFMPLEVCLDQLPQRLDKDGRHWSFEYKPLFAEDGETLRQLLIVSRDITADVEREAAEAEQRETTAIFHKVLQDREGFLEFYEEASKIVQRVVAGGDDPLVTKRLVHTLKGNCGFFGLATVARFCHDAEQRMLEVGGDLAGQDRIQLRRLWQQVASRLGSLIGDDASERIEVERDDYVELFEAIVSNAPRTDMARMLAQWKCEPMTRRLARIAGQARALGKRLGKEGLVVAHEANQVRLPREPWADFWSAFAHVIRNAVDHGIEPAEERTRMGKPEWGKLFLTTYREGRDFVVEIRDDGRGIDWEGVRAKAAKRGLPHETQDDLEAALFCDGFSTKSVASTTSGRGVGMNAIQDATRQKGGQIELESTPDVGTTFRFRFPI
ncbi:MAG: ATP-binding protein [Myxococcota bacterium]